MGCCQSSTQLGKITNSTGGDNDTQHKLLILGISGSGKSTFFKQCRIICGEGYSDSDYKQFIPQIFNQILTSMKRMIDATDTQYSSIKHKQLFDNLKFNESIANSVEFVTNQSKNIEFISDTLASHLTNLWENEIIQKIFELRGEISVCDSTEYFMNQLNRISSLSMKMEYIPTQKDLLMVYYPTNSVIENTLTIEGTKFKFIDVGGQRQERKKWIHYWNNVSCVIFVASLASYNETLHEDSDVNAMHETLNLFERQVNSKLFENTCFVLLLTKFDVFEKKVSKCSIKTAFPEYAAKGREDFDSFRSLEFIKRQFRTRNKNGRRQVYEHVVDVLNGDIDSRIHDIAQVTMNSSVKRGGLI